VTKKSEVVVDLPEPAKVSEFIEIPFRDGVVTIPRERGKWPTRAILAMSRGDNLKATEHVLGVDQWEHVIDSEIDEFEAFIRTFADVALEQVFNNE
jgi:hypothetical protein